MVLGLALSIVPGKASYPVPTNGLIGYWPGDGTAADVSPAGNNGSFGGSYASGPTGGAFNLATAKVIIPNNPVYNFQHYTSGWSVGFWFNGNGAPINANNGLFLGQDNGSGYNPKWFIDYGYSVWGDFSEFIFHVNDYNQERIFVGSQTGPAPTGWNQLTVTINNTNNGTVDFYLNGQSIGSATLGNYVLETSAPLVFGQAEGLSFSGLISDVVIYDRVLATNEVWQIANPPPLTITSQPANVSVSTGGTATFAVGVTGLSPFSFQWALNGTNIRGATNASLTLTNISSAEVGVYTVIITNSLGGLASAGASLTTVDIRMFAGIVVNGIVGTNYTIQSTPALSATNWVTLTNIDLPSSPYIYIDYSSITNPSRYYRVFTTPSSKLLSVGGRKSESPVSVVDATLKASAADRLNSEAVPLAADFRGGSLWVCQWRCCLTCARSWISNKARKTANSLITSTLSVSTTPQIRQGLLTLVETGACGKNPSDAAEKKISTKSLKLALEGKILKLADVKGVPS